MTKYTNLWTLALIAALCGCKDKPKKHMDNQVADTQYENAQYMDNQVADTQYENAQYMDNQVTETQKATFEEAENSDVIDSPQNMTTAYLGEEEKMDIKTSYPSMFTADNDSFEGEKGLV